MEKKIYEILIKMHPEYDFKSSKNFVEDGYLDSFDVVTLVVEIESEFGILIDGLDVLPENFESIESICKLIINSDGK